MQNDRKMTIYFKNGQTIEVSKSICNAIANAVTTDGLIAFKDSKDGIYLVVNLSEILYIKESPNLGSKLVIDTE
jgi:hypothetical protein